MTIVFAEGVCSEDALGALAPFAHRALPPTEAP